MFTDLEDARTHALAARDVVVDVALGWGRSATLEEPQRLLVEVGARLLDWAALELDDARILPELDDVRGVIARVTSRAPEVDRDTLEEIAGMLHELREAVLDWVARLRDVPLRAPQATAAARAVEPFLASGGVAMLVAFPVGRAEVVETEEERAARLDVEADADDEDDDDDDDDAEVGATLARFGVALPVPARRETSRLGSAPADDDGRAELEWLGRQGLFELAGLFPLSSPLEDAEWTAAEAPQRRLGATLDALVALAMPRSSHAPSWDLAARSFAFATEWDVPDLGRTFAWTFPLACARSTSAIDALRFALRRSQPRVAPALEAALALGVAPGLDQAVEAWMEGEEDVVRLTTLLAVARRRRIVTMSVIPLVAHPADAVAIASVDVLARAPVALATPILEDLTADPRRPRVAVAAAGALLRQGRTAALDALRGAVDGWLAAGHEAAVRDVIRTLAIAGDRRDAPWLLATTRLLRRTQTALGTFGRVELAPELVERLGAAQDPEEREDLVEALHRLTGLGYVARVLEEGRECAPGELLPSRLAPPSEPTLQLARTAPAWAEAWRRASDAFASAGAKDRFRFGRPLGAPSLVDELACTWARQRTRRVALVELELTLGRPLDLDVDDWVVRQREALAALRELVAAQRSRL